MNRGYIKSFSQQVSLQVSIIAQIESVIFKAICIQYLAFLGLLNYIIFILHVDKYMYTKMHIYCLVLTGEYMK